MFGSETDPAHYLQGSKQSLSTISAESYGRVFTVRTLLASPLRAYAARSERGRRYLTRSSLIANTARYWRPSLGTLLRIAKNSPFASRSRLNHTDLKFTTII